MALKAPTGIEGSMDSRISKALRVLRLNGFKGHWHIAVTEGIEGSMGSRGIEA